MVFLLQVFAFGKNHPWLVLLETLISFHVNCSGSMRMWSCHRLPVLPSHESLHLLFLQKFGFVLTIQFFIFWPQHELFEGFGIVNFFLSPLKPVRVL